MNDKFSLIFVHGQDVIAAFDHNYPVPEINEEFFIQDSKTHEPTEIYYVDRFNSKIIRNKEDPARGDHYVRLVHLRKEKLWGK
jgi:hypothetical protein